MAEWVALRPIFEVCVNETSYKGGGKLPMPWWIQAASEKQLRLMLGVILAAARERQRQESGRRGEGKGRVEGEGTYSDGVGGGTGESVCWDRER